MYKGGVVVLWLFYSKFSISVAQPISDFIAKIRSMFPTAINLNPTKNVLLKGGTSSRDTRYMGIRENQNHPRYSERGFTSQPLLE